MKKVQLSLTPQKYRGILKEGLSLDHLFLLILSEREINIGELTEPKERALLQTIRRKQLVDERGMLLEEGKRILEYIRAKDEDVLKLGKIISHTEFDEWWEVYPATDTIIKNNNIIIKGSRSLRNKKDECRVKFNTILKEKEFTTSQLIKALQYEVNLKVEKSIRERKNHLSFMKNTHAYLEQRAYEGFIKLSEMATSHTNNTGIVGI